jgi:hypothetical protein
MTGAPAAGVPERSGRLAFAAAALLAAFAALFTAGSALGIWPQPPSGAFAGWDLWVGTAVGLTLLIRLLLP